MDRSARANYLLTAVSVAGIGFIIYRIVTSVQIGPLAVIGLSLAIPSTVLLVTARIQLGSSFALQAKAKHLVTGGIYSKVRHPIYLFAQIILFGLLLCVYQPAFLLCWCFLLIIQIIRSKKEDKILEEKFGDEYREYKKKTWF
jgi:protein-S-isoprenylcysteine O-methyltransferase Ste14